MSCIILSSGVNQLVRRRRFHFQYCTARTESDFTNTHTVVASAHIVFQLFFFFALAVEKDMEDFLSIFTFFSCDFPFGWVELVTWNALDFDCDVIEGIKIFLAIFRTALTRDFYSLSSGFSPYDELVNFCGASRESSRRLLRVFFFSRHTPQRSLILLIDFN